MMALGWPWPFYDNVKSFNDNVKFDNLGFSIGKSENGGFLRNYCSLWPVSWYMQRTNWVNEGMLVLKVNVILVLKVNVIVYM